MSVCSSRQLLSYPCSWRPSNQAIINLISSQHDNQSWDESAGSVQPDWASRATLTTVMGLQCPAVLCLDPTVSELLPSKLGPHYWRVFTPEQKSETIWTHASAVDCL